MAYAINAKHSGDGFFRSVLREVMKLHRPWIAILLSGLCAAVVTRDVEAASYQMNIKSVPEAGSKCVSTPDGQFVEGMRVFIWDCNAPLAQMLSYDDQTQQLKFGVHCVEALGQGNPRDAVGVGTCNGSASQRWSMVQAKDNYQIIGPGNLCLNISNGVTANGTPLELSTCVPNNAVQLWALYQAPNTPAVQNAPKERPATNLIAQAAAIVAASPYTLFETELRRP
jgi:hypothetical protein